MNTRREDRSVPFPLPSPTFAFSQIELARCYKQRVPRLPDKIPLVRFYGGDLRPWSSGHRLQRQSQLLSVHLLRSQPRYHSASGSKASRNFRIVSDTEAASPSSSKDEDRTNT